MRHGGFKSVSDMVQWQWRCPHCRTVMTIASSYYPPFRGKKGEEDITCYACGYLADGRRIRLPKRKES